MKLSSFTSRFWVAAALIAFTLLLGGVGPLIVNTDPNAVIGGLRELSAPNASRRGAAPDEPRAEGCVTSLADSA